MAWPITAAIGVHFIKEILGAQYRKVRPSQNTTFYYPEGMELPYLCRNGVCLTCTGKILEGFGPEVRKDSQCHNEDNINDGYICTCSTYIGGPGVKIQMGMFLLLPNSASILKPVCMHCHKNQTTAVTQCCIKFGLLVIHCRL